MLGMLGEGGIYEMMTGAEPIWILRSRPDSYFRGTTSVHVCARI